METTLSPVRWRQIAIANFDYYVATRFAAPSWIVTNDGIDKRELSGLAQLIGCDPKKLCSIIITSLMRTTRNDRLSLKEFEEDGKKEDIVVVAVSEDEEEEIIKSILKFSIKESPTLLQDVKRRLGRMPHILNHQSVDLKVSVQELSVFIKPLYKEVIDETLTF